jgi:hypothetical protein
MQEVLKAATVESHIAAPQAAFKHGSIDYLDPAALRDMASKIFKDS